MVLSFPLDYLHLICLGIVTKLLVMWIKGNTNMVTKISTKDSKCISDKLRKACSTQPIEFNRAIRGLDVISFWKGTEFRTFLLYTGPIA